MIPKNNIDALIDLNGVVIEQVGGYWTKFEAQRTAEITEERPHGIRYSLTLHDRYGNRIIGFDNAHAVKSKKTCRKYDHRHRHINDECIPYEFVDAHQLLIDFWKEVDKTLTVLGIER